jgi:hypothetical protein
MQYEIIEENYQPKPGKMGTRRLRVAYKDEIAGYTDGSYRINHAELVLDEDEVRILRPLIERGCVIPFAPTEADAPAVESLVRKGVLHEHWQMRPGEVGLATGTGPGWGVLAELIDLE